MLNFFAMKKEGKIIVDLGHLNELVSSYMKISWRFEFGVSNDKGKISQGGTNFVKLEFRNGLSFIFISETTGTTTLCVL